jgi:hypothetical protein
VGFSQSHRPRIKTGAARLPKSPYSIFLAALSSDLTDVSPWANQRKFNILVI